MSSALLWLKYLFLLKVTCFDLCSSQAIQISQQSPPTFKQINSSPYHYCLWAYWGCTHSSISLGKMFKLALTLSPGKASGRQLNWTPFIMSFWDWSLSQFFLQQTVHLYICPSHEQPVSQEKTVGGSIFFLYYCYLFAVFLGYIRIEYLVLISWICNLDYLISVRKCIHKTPKSLWKGQKTKRYPKWN